VTIYQLLGRCAKVEVSPAELANLRQAVALAPNLTRLVEEAEAQRMAPLFYFHTRAAGAELPEDIRLTLQGLTLRHTAAAEVRTVVLKELLALAQGAGIQVILLKGAATAYLAYPSPALRPMRDLDILVRPADLTGLYAILERMGFVTPVSHSSLVISDKHLPHAELKRGGLTVTLEVHTRLFDSLWRPKQPTADKLFQHARPFEIDGQPALSLSLEDLLWHTYQHLVIEDIRLNGIADLVSLSQRYVDEIDWGLIRRRYPALLEALSVIHFLTPLPPVVIERAGIHISKAPADIGKDWSGWPRLAYGRGRGKRLTFLKETFRPSEWFLRLYYGVGSTRPIWPTAVFRHPLHVASLAWLRLVKRTAR
jgi:hypothetical protein